MSLLLCHVPAEREEDNMAQPQAPHVPALVNGSPKPPHIEVPGHGHPQPYDVTLQRRDNEGFGFVILTSKNKPPVGGQTFFSKRSPIATFICFSFSSLSSGFAVSSRHCTLFCLVFDAICRHAMTFNIFG